MRPPAWALLALVSALPATAAAAPPTATPIASPPSAPALFAIVIGVNRSVDVQLAPLSYADDDAFRYRDLFRSVQARTVVLTRADENTRRINADVDRVDEPVDRALSQAVSSLAAEVLAARKAGRPTTLYFVYAGHGNLGKQGAYLTLEDQRLTGADLDRRVLRAIGADESHVIVDACYSYLLVHERGPGGKAREVRGFSQLSGLLERQDVGLLLSTSSARESHEWQEFQAGVFSHEVRSGLYGAADTNADGQVSYREIAAFINWANAAIPNERFRPEVFSRPPRGRTRLLDLRAALADRVTVDLEVEAGHHLMEDQQGNRVAEFHNSRGQAVRLLRPPAAGVLFIRHVGSGREFEIPPGPGDRRLSTLAARSAPLRTRGAAHHAFARIFSLPFDDWVVEQFQPEGDSTPSLRAEVSKPNTPGKPDTFGWRKQLAIGAAGLAVLSAGATWWAVASTRSLERQARQSNQVRAAELNRTLDNRRSQAIDLAVGTGVATTGALLLWFWPTTPVQPAVAAAPGQPLVLGASGRF
jgi:hypothetical protein